MPKSNPVLFECWVCLCLTDRVVLGGASLPLSIRTVCPYASKCWHHELELKIASAQNDLEKNKLRLQIKEQIVFDLKGDPGKNPQKMPMTNVHTWRYAADGMYHNCRHYPVFAQPII